jgi:CRISPR type I-D-associated protein Csc1
MIASQLLLQFHSPIYFVSMEYGSESKVSNVLSHYSIVYALNDRENGISYAMVEGIKKGRKTVRPPVKYRSFGLFSTAAVPIKIAKNRYIYNTRPEHYFFWENYSRGAVRSLRINRSNFPVYGSKEVILPESEFKCWVLSRTEVDFPEIITLGKKRGLARVTEIQKIPATTEKEGVFKTPGPLLYSDLFEKGEEVIEGKFYFAGHHMYVDGKIKCKYTAFGRYGIPCSLLESL